MLHTLVCNFLAAIYGLLVQRCTVMRLIARKSTAANMASLKGLRLFFSKQVVPFSRQILKGCVCATCTSKLSLTTDLYNGSSQLDICHAWHEQ
jgi:hypothetical protein